MAVQTNLTEVAQRALGVFGGSPGVGLLKVLGVALIIAGGVPVVGF